MNQLETEMQRLYDEVNRLKGEQGKPNIKPNKSNQTDISSEQERQKAAADASENGEAESKKKNAIVSPGFPRFE